MGGGRSRRRLRGGISLGKLLIWGFVKRNWDGEWGVGGN